MPHWLRALFPLPRSCRKARAAASRRAERLHASALPSAHFPFGGTVASSRSGEAADGAGICYNDIMAKQRKPTAKGTKVGGFVVGRAHFAKISAVERIERTEVMKKRASDAARKGLTAEEYRRTIVRSYRKD
jgi:hypothetical protein